MGETQSLNQKIKELEKAREWFYSDEFNLDEAAAKYKEAIDLAKKLQKDLDDLQNEIEILDKNFAE